MAKVHILDTDQSGRTRCVFHLQVPATNNYAGIPWPAVVINSGLGGRTILADGDGTRGTISAAEKAQIAAGGVYEHPDTVTIPPGLTLAEANAFLDTLHAAKTAEVQARVVRLLDYYGFIRT